MADQSESDRIERVWKILHEHDCLPYGVSIRDISPGDQPITESELKELQAADKEADQKNTEFCRSIVEAAQVYKVSRVGDDPKPLHLNLRGTLMTASAAEAMGSAFLREVQLAGRDEDTVHVLFEDAECRRLALEIAPKAKCPGCELRLFADDAVAQRAHLEKEHPEIIGQRLEYAGFELDGKGDWLDTLATEETP